MKAFSNSALYLSRLHQRKKESHIHREFQSIGIEVAELLGDIAHKALYIKLAKMYGKDKILPLAKDVADRKNIRNKGAYFMKILASENFHKIISHDTNTDYRK